MSSSIVLGECIYCKELVWEDQPSEGIPLEDIRHLWCERKQKLEQHEYKQKMSLIEEYERLKKRIKELEMAKEVH